jgi:hypothetical protein
MGESIYDVVGRAGEHGGGSAPAPRLPAGVANHGTHGLAASGYADISSLLKSDWGKTSSEGLGSSASTQHGKLVAGSFATPQPRGTPVSGVHTGGDIALVSLRSDYMSVSSPLGLNAPRDTIARRVSTAANNLTHATAAADPSVGLLRRNRCVLATAGLVAVVGGLSAGLYFGLSERIAVAGYTNSENTPNPTPPTVPPPVPQGLQVQPQTNTSLLITWDLLMLTTSVEYVVKRDGKVIGTTPSRVNSFMDRDLQPGARHCYTVAARNEVGTSDESAEVCAVTLSQPPGAPPTPTDLVGLPLSLHGIRFSWASSPGAESYIVLRRLTSESEYTEVATVPATNQQMVFDDHGLEQGVQYCYSVVAVNAAGRSAAAPFVCLHTYDDCDVFAAEVVTQWNQLSEESYWTKMIVWVRADVPDLQCQWVVANFSLGIADMTAPRVLTSEQAIQAVVDSMVAAYDSAKDVLAIYEALKNLVAGRGDPVPRYEKLNVLGRTLAALIVRP